MYQHQNIEELAPQILELLQLGESEEVEFKSAKVGLPKDFWPTYSAFANTHGGIIVLGVKEDSDNHRFSLSGLDEGNAKKLKEDFWRNVNNRQVVSHCLLSNDDVQIVKIEECYVVKFDIPQATHEQRPVYLKSVPYDGTYRRNDSGDYKCERDEVRRMMADADLSHPTDSRILKGCTWDDIDLSSFEQYKRLFHLTKPLHPWLALDNQSLMVKLRGYRKDRESGEEGFTLAGLLMFGKGEAIQDYLPHYFLDYRELYDDSGGELKTASSEPAPRWIDRVYPDGTWEPNLFQFFQKILPKLQSVLPTPFHMEEGQRKEETSAHVALREALANLCVHADYSANGALLVTKSAKEIVFSNPGVMLISRQQFFNGGMSVCRNPAIQQMFMMMGAVEKAGSGVDKILKGWSDAQWQPPYPREKSNPNVVELVMPLALLIDSRIIDELRNRFGNYIDSIDADELRILVTTLTEQTTNHLRLNEMLPLHRADLSVKLQKLCQDGVLVGEGNGRGRVYRLKENAAIMGVHSECESHVVGHNADETSTIAKQIPKRWNVDEREAYICEYCTEWRTIQQIAAILGRTVTYIRNRVLPPMIASGKLARKYPCKSHPEQQYKAVQGSIKSSSE
jgi:putative divergent AAA ATP